MKKILSIPVPLQSHLFGLIQSRGFESMRIGAIEVEPVYYTFLETKGASLLGIILADFR